MTEITIDDCKVIVSTSFSGSTRFSRQLETNRNFIDEDFLGRQQNWYHVFPLIILGLLGMATVHSRLVEMFATQFPNRRNSFLWTGIAESGHNLLSFFCSPVIGIIADAVGRRWVLVLVSVAFIFPFAAVGVGANVWWFIGIRIVTGMFAAFLPILYAYISDVSDRSCKGICTLRFGYAWGVLSIASIYGSALGAVLFWPNIRWISPTCVVFVFLYSYFLPESMLREDGLKIKEAVKFLNPLAQARVLKTGKSAAALTIMLLLVAFADSGYRATTGLYLYFTFGFRSIEFGIWLSIGGIVSAIHTSLFQFYLKFVNERVIVLASLFVGIIGFILTGIATRIWHFYAIALIDGFRHGVLPASLGVMCQEIGANQQGTILACANGCRNLGSAFGPFVFAAMAGYLKTTTNECRPYHFYVSAFIYFLGFLIVLFGTKKSNVA